MYNSFLIYECCKLTQMLFQLGLDVKPPLWSCGSKFKKNKTMTQQDMNCACAYVLNGYFFLCSVSVDFISYTQMALLIIKYVTLKELSMQINWINEDGERWLMKSLFVQIEGQWKCYNHASVTVSGIVVLWLARETMF